VVEVDRTLSTWPQLSSEVVLGATAIAESVRRIGLGKDLRSGRTRIDVGSALDRLDEPQMAIKAPAAASIQTPRCRRDGRHRGSCYSRALCLKCAAVECGDRPRHHHHSACPRTHLDLRRRVPRQRSRARAALFNAKVAAAAQQVLGGELMNDVADSPLEAKLHLADSGDPELAGLYEPMLTRETNRSLGAPRPIRHAH